jgi:hypothetical protein
VLDNAVIAELLIREAETAEGHRERAFRRAAHEAFMWPEEAAAVAAAAPAKIPAERIVNFMAVSDLKAWVESVRTSSTRIRGAARSSRHARPKPLVKP